LAPFLTGDLTGLFLHREEQTCVRGKHWYTPLLVFFSHGCAKLFLMAGSQNAPSLRQLIENLELHNQLCQVYEKPEQWKGALVSFVKAGVQKGHCCLCIGHPARTKPLKRELELEGIDLDAAVRDGAIVFTSHLSAPGKDNGDDPAGLLAFLSGETENALRHGFRTLRVSADMKVIFDGEMGSRDHFHIEKRLHKFFLDHPCLGFWQYDGRVFDLETLRAVSLCHPHILWGTTVRRNYFHLFSPEFPPEAGAEREVEIRLPSQDLKARHGRRPFFADVFAHASQPIVYDYAEGLTFANKAFFKLLGHEGRSSIRLGKGQHISAPKWRATEMKALEELHRTGKPVAYEVEFARPDGSLVPVDCLLDVTLDSEGRTVYLGFAKDVTEKKLQERAVRESEACNRMIVETAEEGIWRSDEEFRTAYANPKLLSMIGYSMEEVMGKSPSFFLFDEDQASYSIPMEERKEGRAARYEGRLKRKDGSLLWVIVSSTLIRDENGVFSGIFAMLTDISALKETEEWLRQNEAKLEDLVLKRTAQLRESEERLRRLADNLITAQETERRKVARELHDDISQRLAILAIELGKFNRSTSAIPVQARQLLTELERGLIGVSTDVHSISSQLHPSIIDDLGLADALRAQCSTFSQRTHIPFCFSAEDVRPDLGRDLSLCTYRIVQEALRNVARHAQASMVTVFLREAESLLTLSISDNGRGFQAGQRKGHGLGLTSMEERARLAGGRLTVSSVPGEGTIVKLEVPLAEPSDRSAGKARKRGNG